MNNRFLNTYSEEEYEHIQDIIDHAESNYPFSIYNSISNYEDCLENKDYHGAQRCLFDTFEVTVQFLSGLLISFLTHRRVAFDEELQEVMQKIVENPASTGTWINQIFFVVLPKTAELLPDNQLVAHLCEQLPAGNNVFQGGGKQPGFIKSIAAYRNEWGHGSYRDSAMIRNEIAEIEPRIWRLLEILKPLEDYRFFLVAQHIDTDTEIKTYNLVPDPARSGEYYRVSSDILLEEDAYYVTDQKLRKRAHLEGGSIIKLTPFVIYLQDQEFRIDEKYQYVFQSVKEGNLSKMTFVSAHKNADRLETELYRESFLELLHRVLGKLINQDRFRVSFNKKKNISEYMERALAQTQDFLNQQKKSNKYDPDLFYERAYLKSSFDDFLAGEARAYVMLGNAGAGKTNQVCHWSAAVRPTCINLAYYSKSFANNTLEDQLKATFGERKKKAADLLADLEEQLEASDMLLCIYFDAINECYTYKGKAAGNGAVDLLEAIDSLLVKQSFRRIKVIMSCRSYTWEELLSNKDHLHLDLYYMAGNDEHITLSGFSPEEFESVYPRYAAKYGLTTPLEELQLDRYDFIRQRLYDPLILKTASENFRGRDLPADLRQFNSTRLFGQRVDELEKKEKGRKQVQVLQEFTALLWEQQTDSVSLNALYSAYESEDHPLHAFAGRIIRNESLRLKDEVQLLLDEGILRIEKGIKKELRFVYERFNEYMFARHFLQIHPSANPRIPIGAAAYEQVLSATGHSTVMIAALRNALIMDFYEKNNDPGTIIRLSLSSLYEAQPLVQDTLAVLLDESYRDVFRIIQQMLAYEKPESVQLLQKREEVEAALSKGKKKTRISEETERQLEARKQEINQQLLAILRVRSIAISVIYTIFKSGHISTLINSAETDPRSLLWQAMADPLPEVRDNASIYIYYISRFDSDMAMRIITDLSDRVVATPVSALLRSSSRKELQQSYIEPACRVGLFLAIDGILERGDYQQAISIRDTWKRVVSKFTFNHVLIKLVWPFFKFLMSRQAVVQKEYVNNGIEYGHFWDSFPKTPEGKGWSRADYASFIPYLDPATPGFEEKKDRFIEGYLTGDSFTLFLLERILAVQGLADWNRVAPIVRHLSYLPASTPCASYIEMSVIYAVYQINLKLPQKNKDAEKCLTEIVEKWQLANKGFYYAHYNDKANGGKPYKQYVLNWYATVYCHFYGDGQPKPGEAHSVEIIRNILSEAYRKRDKALLYNCIENMAMLAATSGYYKTTLQLFEHLISLFRSESEIVEFDEIRLEGKIYEKGLRSFICDMLGTVKSYYPKEVDHFIVNKLKNYQFPDLDAFREEIFNHSLSHEGIGDLLTHKFGNFVIWGIVNDEHIRKFFMQICRYGAGSNNYIEWFDVAVRYCFQEVLGVKNFAA